jgi:hypothetical protein
VMYANNIVDMMFGKRDSAVWTYGDCWLY